MGRVACGPLYCYGCYGQEGMTVDLNRLILGKSYNSTKVFRTAQHVVQAILLGIVVPLLILLLIWDLTDNPNPVPGVVVIAGLVMLCFFFSYVFVVPDDLTSSATDRTLAIASKIFAYTSRGLTPEAALGASKIILSETIASAICFTDGKQVLASWGEDSAKCPAGTPVVLKTTLSVIETGEQSVFSRDTSNETGGYFPRLRAGIVAAKALAFATGAQLVGQDVLAPQCLAHTQATDDRRHLTLAVNDARRRQLYFALYDGGTVADGVGQSPITLIDMDIDYPDSITMRVNDVLTKLADTGKPYVVDVIGHGAVKYAQSWNAIASLGEVDDHALLDEGAEGLARFAAFTTSEQALAEPTSVEPLYLRRPDVSVPNPLKHVLNHAGAERTE